MNWAGGWGLGAGHKLEDRRGLMLEMWNVGWILVVLGSWRQTATGSMTFEVGNGPMNLGASLQLSTLIGRSFVESHTL